MTSAGGEANVCVFYAHAHAEWAHRLQSSKARNKGGVPETRGLRQEQRMASRGRTTAFWEGCSPGRLKMSSAFEIKRWAFKRLSTLENALIEPDSTSPLKSLLIPSLLVSDPRWVRTWAVKGKKQSRRVTWGRRCSDASLPRTSGARSHLKPEEGRSFLSELN